MNDFDYPYDRMIALGLLEQQPKMLTVKDMDKLMEQIKKNTEAIKTLSLCEKVVEKKEIDSAKYEEISKFLTKKYLMRYANDGVYRKVRTDIPRE